VGREREQGAGERNDPNNICAYEYMNKEKKILNKEKKMFHRVCL
jgi:ribosomal protein L32